jgi:hypothetical protein
MRLAIVLGLAAVAAVSAKATGKPMTGDRLYDLCTDEKGSPTFQQSEMFCSGYITGAADMVMGLGSPTVTLICPPDGLTYQQLVDTVVKFLRGNPEKRAFSAYRIVYTGLVQAFPCPK